MSAPGTTETIELKNQMTVMGISSDHSDTLPFKLILLLGVIIGRNTSSLSRFQQTTKALFKGGLPFDHFLKLIHDQCLWTYLKNCLLRKICG